MTRQINQDGLEITKVAEGFRAHAYQDTGGVWTIGYGHTGPDVRSGRVISKAEGERLLRMDLSTAEEAVERYVKVKITDNQFSALVDFAFNVGSGNFQKSTLLKRLNAGKYNAVPAELMKYRYDHEGHALDGLTSRRTKEAELWSRDQVTEVNEDAEPTTKSLSYLTPETGVAALGAAGSVGSAASGPGPLQWAIAFAVVVCVISLAVLAYRRFKEV